LKDKGGGFADAREEVEQKAAAIGGFLGFSPLIALARPIGVNQFGRCDPLSSFRF
jgi:hypothetical protein